MDEDRLVLLSGADNSDKINESTVPKEDTLEYNDSLTTVSKKYGSKDDEG